MVIRPRLRGVIVPSGKDDILAVFDKLLDMIDSHADDYTIFGECRKCELDDDSYRYWDCP